ELIADPAELREDAVRTAGEELSRLDAGVQVQRLQAGALGLRVPPVVAGPRCRVVEGAVARREGAPARAGARRDEVLHRLCVALRDVDRHPVQNVVRLGVPALAP